MEPHPELSDRRQVELDSVQKWPMFAAGFLVVLVLGVTGARVVGSEPDSVGQDAGPTPSTVLGTTPPVPIRASSDSVVPEPDTGPPSTDRERGLTDSIDAPADESVEFQLIDTDLPPDLQRYVGVGVAEGPFTQLFDSGDDPGQVVSLAVVARSTRSVDGVAFGDVAHVWLAYEGPVDWPPIVDRPLLDIDRPYEAFVTEDGALYLTIRHEDISTHVAARIHLSIFDPVLAAELANLIDFDDAELYLDPFTDAGLSAAFIESRLPVAIADYGRAAEIGIGSVARIVLLAPGASPVAALAGTGGIVTLEDVVEGTTVWVSDGPRFSAVALQSPDGVLVVVGEGAPADLRGLGEQVQVVRIADTSGA